MRINRPEYHDPLFFTMLGSDENAEEMLTLHRIDIPERVVDGILTARTQLALAHASDPSLAFDGIDVEVHTSSSYDERHNYPLQCEHGVGSPFISASIEEHEIFSRDNEWRLRKSGARIYELTVPRKRIVIPYYCPPDERTNWYARVREVLVLGDISLDSMSEC